MIGFNLPKILSKKRVKKEKIGKRGL